MRQILAFTLIELLVVVAIIVVLLALLMPGLEKATSAAERVQCLANEHGVGHALSLWLSDHKRTYPEYNGAWWCGLLGKLGNHGYDGGNAVTSDMRVLNPYLGSPGKDANVAIASCPSDSGDPLVGVDIRYSLYDAIGTSYLAPLGQYSGIKPVTGVKNHATLKPMRSSQITRTDNKIILGDWVLYGNRPLGDPRTQRHSGPDERRVPILFANFSAEWFYFDNDLIDDAVNPSNKDRIPNPSFYWW